jgi:P27 family predicted phage terminase small subunit
MLGRKPTPAALKKLRGSGNATREKTRGNEPKPPGRLSQPPSWMNARQKAGWRYALRHAPARLLTPIDSGVLSVWVLAEDQLRTAAQMQNKLHADAPMRMLMKGGRGVIMVSPYIGIMHKAGAVMIRAGEQLGFTPAARPRLGDGDKDTADDADSPWTMLKVLQGGKA